MQFDRNKFDRILSELKPYHAKLVAVTKKKTVEDIRAAYDSGQRIFGENYVQELVDKSTALPGDIQWHFIGHLQSNKVKLIAPFVSLIHGVDSFNLLKEIDKQGKKNDRIIDCLLQVHIATEETKFGLSFGETEQLLSHPEFHRLKNICVKGLMGMASFSEDRKQVREEFHSLSAYFHQLQSRVFTAKKLNGKSPPLLIPQTDEIKSETIVSPGQLQTSNLKPEILSMGMSGDYKIALLEGSTMVRIGSLIFGER